MAMKRKITLYLLLLSGFLFSCNNQLSSEKKGNKLDSILWLPGVWENKDSLLTTTETWERFNDTVFSGKSVSVAGNDTVFSESIRLVQIVNTLFYMPTVEDQNQGKEISFKLTSFSPDCIVFENPSHDFPQKITYRKISNDSLIAEISGMENNRQKSEIFSMKRIK
jgi:hypothetical protein